MACVILYKRIQTGDIQVVVQLFRSNIKWLHLGQTGVFIGQKLESSDSVFFII